MLFDPIDAQHLNKDGLIMLFDITSDSQEYIKKSYILQHVLVSDSGEVGKQ